MSLDITLYTNWREYDHECETCGRTHKCRTRDEVYSTNITHNLNAMADEAGIYNSLWHPDTDGISQAGQLIDLLSRAVSDMHKRPEYYQRFNSQNGWGTYSNFYTLLEKLLDACKKFPDATIEVYR